jgi:hypothetical protein
MDVEIAAHYGEESPMPFATTLAIYAGVLTCTLIHRTFEVEWFCAKIVRRRRLAV